MIWSSRFAIFILDVVIKLLFGGLTLSWALNFLAERLSIRYSVYLLLLGVCTDGTRSAVSWLTWLATLGDYFRKDKFRLELRSCTYYSKLIANYFCIFIWGLSWCSFFYSVHQETYLVLSRLTILCYNTLPSPRLKNISFRSLVTHLFLSFSQLTCLILFLSIILTNFTKIQVLCLLILLWL